MRSPLVPLVSLVSLALLLVVCSSSYASGECDPGFYDVVRYGLDEEPWSVVADDFDRDGRPDIAAMGNQTRRIALLLNRGAGFTHGTSVGLPAEASELIGPVDVDGGGKDEMIALGASAITTLKRSGDGTFRTISTPVPGDPLTNFYGHGDLNGDGRTDLAVLAQRGSGSSAFRSLRVFLAKPDGTFAEPAAPIALTSRIFDVRLARVTADGSRDVILADYRGGVLLEGNGDGTFKPARALIQDGSVQTLRLDPVDVDGDGRDDIVVNSRSLLLVAQPEFLSDLPITADPHPIDLNGDGRLDLFTRRETAINKGDGTFTINPHAGGTGPGSRGLAFADFDGDRNLDYVTGTAWNDVAIHYGRGNDQYDGSQSIGATYPFIHPLTGDLNGDGRDDIVAVSATFIAVYLANEDGLLMYKSFLDNPASAAALGDFNGDGKLDLFANFNNVALGNGDGTFTAGVWEAGSAASEALTIDANADGKVDAVLAGGVETAQGGSGQVTFLLNDGTGQFSPTHATTAPVYGIAAADFNADGLPDIVAATRLRNAGALYLIDGRNRTTAVAIATGTASTVGTGDFDGDGHADIVSLDDPLDAVLVFSGNGNGTFRAPRRVNVPNGSLEAAVTVGDFTGDGRDDVVVTARDWDEAILFVQQSDGTLAETAQTPGGWWRARSGDFDGDGRLDLVFDRGPSSGFAVAFNRCRQELRTSAPVVRLTSSSPASRQGSPVILTAIVDAPAAGTVSFYEWLKSAYGYEAVPIGSANIVAGRAALTLSTLGEGTHELYAVYRGEGAYARSRSATVEQVVTKAAAGKRKRSVRH